MNTIEVLLEPFFSLHHFAGNESVKLTPIAIAKSRDAATEDHEAATNGNGDLSAIVVGNIRGDEERDDGTDVEHVDENAKLVVILDVVSKVLAPCVDLLRGVDEHAIVTGGGRGDHQEDGHEVEVAQMRLLGPGDLLEPGSICTGNLDVVLHLMLNGVLGRHLGRCLGVYSAARASETTGG
jgi:hypothetical protein